MASVDSSLISDPKEQKWVGEISEILKHQLEIEVEIPPISIFKTPETITTTKPEAYKPQQIGFGPYHHFQPVPYTKMEQKKLVVLQKVLQYHKIKDIRLNVVDKVEKLVPVIRACYEMFLQDDNVSMAWVFAIDGLFLLNLFETYDNRQAKVDPTKRLLAQDIMMVENQIPYMVLKEISEALHTSSGTNASPSVFPSKEEARVAQLLHNSAKRANFPPSVFPSEEVQIDQPLDIPETRYNFSPSAFPSKEGARVTQLLHNSAKRANFSPSMFPSEEEVRIDQLLDIPVTRDKVSISVFPIEEKAWVVHQPPDIPMARDKIGIDLNDPASVEEMYTGFDQPSHSGLTFSPNSIFRSFSEIHSPLELCSQSQAPARVEHLLHYMYHSIINNDPIKNIHIPITKTKPPSVKSDAPSLSDITNSISHVSNFLKKVPEKEIVQLYEQTVTSLQSFSRNKVTIPSASKLQGRLGFKFHNLPKDGGVQNVYKDENNIYLPCITLNNDSEVILRNLVAYETLMPNSSNRFPLTEYMGLMCGLIVNVEDVKLLKKANIIKGELGDDEVAKIFVGMSSSILTIKSKEKSKLQKMIDDVIEVHEKKPRVKAYLFVKKLAKWLLVVLTTIGSFVGATWKIVAFMVSVVTVFMLTYQAYCDVYGCDKKSATLLSYASI